MISSLLSMELIVVCAKYLEFYAAHVFKVKSFQSVRGRRPTALSLTDAATKDTPFRPSLLLR